MLVDIIHNVSYLSVSWYSHVGSLFHNEDQKKTGSRHLQYFATHAGLVHDVTDTTVYDVTDTIVYDVTDTIVYDVTHTTVYDVTDTIVCGVTDTTVYNVTDIMAALRVTFS